MSLLMDALRKAERARAARREGGPGETPAEPGLSLDPMEEPRGRPRSGSEGGPGGARTWGPASGESAERFELEPGDDESLELGLSDDRLRTAEEGLEDTDLGPYQDRDEATAATLPSLKAARDSVDRYFDDTGSSSLSMEHVVPPEGETTITGRRRAVERERTRESARAVFAAKDTRRRRSAAGPWVLFLGVPLVLGLAAAGGYFYWLASGGSAWSGNARGRPSPVQARGPAMPAARGTVAGGEGLSARAAPGAPAPSAPVSAALAAAGAAGAHRPAGATERVAGAGGTKRSGAGSEAGSTVAAAPSSGDLSPQRAKPASAAAPERAASGEPPVLSDEQFETMLGRASPLPKGFDGAARIRVTHRRTRDPTRATLQRAYAQYMKGNLAEAEAQYKTVLSHKPRDRDALLGLAAVAARGGDLDRAKEYYLRVLGLNPRDAVAQASLIALYTDVDPVEGESQLKTLLERNPDAGYLSFSLGNVYARQSRWSEAQEAYFQALRADAGNPDYAYNLAVSLDRLGQSKAALKYYQSALELSDGRPAGFAADAALSRIRAIAAGSG